jgi:hypothetical protein
LKVLIFGCPRTGTTLLQLQLGEIFNLSVLNEPFIINHESYLDPVSWVSSQQNCIIKLLPAHLLVHERFDLMSIINAGNFDLILVTDRKNLTDTCISLFYAEVISKQCHYTNTNHNHTPFICDIEFIESLETMKTNNIQYQMIDYDSYNNGEVITVGGKIFDKNNPITPFLDMKIDYKNLCINYKEVETCLTFLYNN